MSNTATTHGAREHARAQEAAAAAKVRAKPTIPASRAVDLPEGVLASSVVWDETLGAGDYAARVLEPGTRLLLEDCDGDACIQLLVFNADNPAERLNVADTVKVQWQAYLGEGAILVSDMGRVLFSIVRDQCGHHDTFCGASNERTNAAKYGDGANYGKAPNARERFLLALLKAGLHERDLGPNINLFKGVRVEKGGALVFEEGTAAPGQQLELRAEMRVLVVLVNTPHVLDPRPTYTSGPVRLLGYLGAKTANDDAIRNSTPERRRAFENTEDYLATIR